MFAHFIFMRLSLIYRQYFNSLQFILIVGEAQSTRYSHFRSHQLKSFSYPYAISVYSQFSLFLSLSIPYTHRPTDTSTIRHSVVVYWCFHMNSHSAPESLTILLLLIRNTSCLLIILVGCVSVVDAAYIWLYSNSKLLCFCLYVEINIDRERKDLEPILSHLLTIQNLSATNRL